jgi:hypothetical protein
VTVATRTRRLTVFRHFDSASVVKGLVGEPPKTAWVIGYGLLERIHYLLVAGFDVYGNVGHQLLSRLYMDFMRMEGEFNFLAFLPLDQRKAVRDYWYRGAERGGQGPRVRDAWRSFDSRQRDQAFVPDEPRAGVLRAAAGNTWHPCWISVATTSRKLSDAGLARTISPLSAGTCVDRRCRGCRNWSYLRVDDPRAHAALFHAVAQHRPQQCLEPAARRAANCCRQENTLTRGGRFHRRLPERDLPRTSARRSGALAKAIKNLSSERDYRVLAERYVVRRSNPRFWQYSDELQNAHLKGAPIAAGLLDYNRLDNR